MAHHEILSPLPGIFYRCPSPDSPPFVEEGAAVEAGTTIGLIEVMKQFSELKTEVAGVVGEFEIGNADSIAPGQLIVCVDMGD
ncbi:MAG: Biotin carboxyl carrier protein of acetyl-CoA carboxylase [Candidatus Celerinatantimonas neptuna]|nr:MAG: Biotin carboxyl carrier protein of acetyl-CoA carboxylase [Candidatus Celerinatantimonas neptuna]